MQTSQLLFLLDFIFQKSSRGRLLKPVLSHILPVSDVSVGSYSYSHSGDLIACNSDVIDLTGDDSVLHNYDRCFAGKFTNWTDIKVEKSDTEGSSITSTGKGKGRAKRKGRVLVCSDSESDCIEKHSRARSLLSQNEQPLSTTSETKHAKTNKPIQRKRSGLIDRVASNKENSDDGDVKTSCSKNMSIKMKKLPLSRNMLAFLSQSDSSVGSHDCVVPSVSTQSDSDESIKIRKGNSRKSPFKLKATRGPNMARRSIPILHDQSSSNSEQSTADNLQALSGRDPPSGDETTTCDRVTDEEAGMSSPPHNLPAPQDDSDPSCVEETLPPVSVQEKHDPVVPVSQDTQEMTVCSTPG